MIQINHIDHINLNVKNLESTSRFYREHFGLKTFEEGVSPSSGRPYLIIGKKGVMFLCLYETPGDFFDRNKQGLNHIGFHVENFDNVVNYIKDKGLKVTWDLIDWGKSRSIYIEYPDGHEIELAEKFGGGF